MLRTGTGDAGPRKVEMQNLRPHSSLLSQSFPSNKILKGFLSMLTFENHWSLLYPWLQACFIRQGVTSKAKRISTLRALFFLDLELARHQISSHHHSLPLCPSVHPPRPSFLPTGLLDPTKRLPMLELEQWNRENHSIQIRRTKSKP